MGLFDRRKNKSDIGVIQNAININDLNENAYFRPYIWNWKKGRFDFGAFFLQLIIGRIFNGMRNVTWQTSEINYLATDLTAFVDKNEQLLLWSYWSNGYACIIVDDKIGFRLPKQNELRLDQNGYIVNRNAVVVYSDCYVTQRLTHFKLCLPILKNINSNLNNANFAVENLGALGILSSKSIPLSPAGKTELQQRLSKDYGLGEEQFRFILSNQEMSYTPIELPIKDLEFNSKVKDDLEWLCGFFNINPNYIFLGTTFSNVAEAKVEFYRDCIQPLSEMLLQLARTTFIYADTDLKPSTVISYKITNTPELNQSLSAESEEQIKYLELLDKLNTMGIDVSTEINKVYEYAKKMWTEV